MNLLVLILRSLHSTCSYTRKNPLNVLLWCCTRHIGRDESGYSVPTGIDSDRALNTA